VCLIATHLALREILQTATERKKTATTYVGGHGSASYNAMRRAFGVMWKELRGLILVCGIRNFELYMKAWVAAETARRQRITTADIEGNAWHRIATFLVYR
jgi:hypothetical protein